MATIVICGVSGSGKTTVANALGARLQWLAWDADNFHTALSLAKLKKGKGLTDEDRAVWLDLLREQIQAFNKQNQNNVLACSALKAKYRSQMTDDQECVKFILLQVDIEVATERALKRQADLLYREQPDHIADVAIIPSQFETLEISGEVDLILDATLPVEVLVDKIVDFINKPQEKIPA